MPISLSLQCLFCEQIQAVSAVFSSKSQIAAANKIQGDLPLRILITVQCDVTADNIFKKSALGAVHILVIMRTMCILTTRRTLCELVRATFPSRVWKEFGSGPDIALGPQGSSKCNSTGGLCVPGYVCRDRAGHNGSH